MSLCANRNISFKPYFIAKLCQGAIAALMIKLYFLFLSPTFDLHSETLSVSAYDSLLDIIALPILICLTAVLLFGAIRKINHSKKQAKKTKADSR